MKVCQSVAFVGEVSGSHSCECERHCIRTFASCSLMEVCCCFRDIYRLRHQGPGDGGGMLHYVRDVYAKSTFSVFCSKLCCEVIVDVPGRCFFLDV
jgi:hypothetical protein